jgi:hypothetical protein
LGAGAARVWRWREAAKKKFFSRFHLEKSANDHRRFTGAFSTHEYLPWRGKSCTILVTQCGMK